MLPDGPHAWRADAGIELPLAKEPASPQLADPDSKDIIVDAGKIKLHLSQQALDKQHSPKQLSTDIVGEPIALRHLSTSSNNSNIPANREGNQNSSSQHDAENQIDFAKQADNVASPEAATADAEDARLLEGHAREDGTSSPVAEAPQKWYRDKPILKAVLGSALVAFSWNFLDELTPIFVSAPLKQVSQCFGITQ